MYLLVLYLARGVTFDCMLTSIVFLLKLCVVKLQSHPRINYALPTKRHHRGDVCKSNNTKHETNNTINANSNNETNNNSNTTTATATTTTTTTAATTTTTTTTNNNNKQYK